MARELITEARDKIFDLKKGKHISSTPGRIKSRQNQVNPFKQDN